MNHHLGEKTKNRASVGALFATALVLGCALAACTRVVVTPLKTPAAITPPAGNSAFLEGDAVGTQGYVCLPTSAAAASWTVNGSRPQATLYSDQKQIVTHFLSPDTNPNPYAPNPVPVGSPTWQSSLDSSIVWGKALTPALVSGSDPSCPNRDAIPCLLLQAIGSKTGPRGGNRMTKTTFIQRLKTTGGIAPASGCSVPADVGKQALVPYTAEYYFFAKDK